MKSYARALLKLSGEALMGISGLRNRSCDRHSAIATDVAKVVATGTQLAIVVGGGNIFRGLKGSAAGMDRATADYVGMLATVMNAITLQDGLERVGVQTRVQTAIAMQEVAEPYIRRKAMRHLEKGRVVVFGAGCGNPFFTTDTTAALRAAEINADVVFKATKVDGVYDKDPAKHPDAVKHDQLSYQDVLSGELGVMDATAISLCKENNIPIVVFDLFEPGNIGKAVAGEAIGSRIGTQPEAPTTDDVPTSIMSTKDLEASMRKSLEATQRNFNTIRTGRANSALLDRISVEYYGADTPLKSLATSVHAGFPNDPDSTLRYQGLGCDRKGHRHERVGLHAQQRRQGDSDQCSTVNGRAPQRILQTGL